MNEGLFFRRADGAEIPVKEVEGLKGNGLLILMTETFLREEDMQKMQQSIERRIGDGTRVLVLDARIKKVMRLDMCGRLAPSDYFKERRYRRIEVQSMRPLRRTP